MMKELLTSSSSVVEPANLLPNSGRESPVSLPEFDGETVLCRVCGDKASGFHYGVHACEGCKGFFRRSIQQKIQYRPCLKNQQCNIQRVNRNRCQYCRLKKCISVGMSRDAVRFGRVPKKEKARIIEQMQKKNSTSQSTELSSMLANDFDVVQAVVTAHRHTCDMTLYKVSTMREMALRNSDFVNCPANMACPLNNEIVMDSNANRQDLNDISESFTPAIKSVVEFARGIPGFVLLNQDDQVTLLKAGTFEVLLVRLACLFDPLTNTMMFTKGKLFKRPSSTVSTSTGFLLDSMFDFADRFNKMCLVDDEIALFSGVVLMSPDRPGLRCVEQVEKIQNKLTEALQSITSTTHKEDPTLFAKLLMKTTDLRTLNTLHSEKSIANQRPSNERRERQSTEDIDMECQETSSSRSGRSSPSPSETSAITVNSGYGTETESSACLAARMALENANHQQVVLRTPYGTFFKEETAGIYGMMGDQPRRRCNTLDRETLTRPRLHTIEEGNRRRYTLDKDYINKMVNRLGERLENRETAPTSINSSATSSPIQEEGLYAAHSPGFVPIPSSDGMSAPSHLNRTSPLVTSGSSPGSPKSRSRSGSLSQDDYHNMRPRCYSLHLNSEGRAARMPLQRRLHDREQVSPDSQFLSAEMRRGSVGASYNLHNRKPAMLMDRSVSYLRRQESGRPEVDKQSTSGPAMPFMKQVMADGSIYNVPINPELSRDNAMWAQSVSAMAAMNPPTSISRRPRDENPDWENRTPEIRGHSMMPTDLTVDQSTHKSVNFGVLATSSPAPVYPVPVTSPPSVNSSQFIPQSSISREAQANKPSKINSPNSISKSNSMLDPESYSPKLANMLKSETTQAKTHSDEIETFGHKKFDKFRKDKSHDAHGSDSKNKEKIVKDEEMIVDDSSNFRLEVSPSVSTRSSPGLSDKKVSAKEAHPNLLAHLTNSGSQSTASPGYSRSFQNQPDNLNQNTFIKSEPMATNISNVNQIYQSTSDARVNSKEEFHAAAVSHLKDKLMRKIDNMDTQQKSRESPPINAINSNLSNIGIHTTSAISEVARSNSFSAPTSRVNYPGLSAVTGSIHGAFVNPKGISSNWNSANDFSSTTDLNRELATKLTLSSNVMPASNPLTVSSASPFVSTSSSSSVSAFPTTTTGMGPTGIHPSMTQLPQLLLAQGINPAAIPAYQNMIGDQLQKPPGTNHFPIPPLPNMPVTLANMHHFAHMFARPQNISTDQRCDISMNLKAKIDDGQSISTSPSPSPGAQTPA